MQLDQLDKDHALVLVRGEGGKLNLKTVDTAVIKKKKKKKKKKGEGTPLVKIPPSPSSGILFRDHEKHGWPGAG